MNVEAVMTTDVKSCQPTDTLARAAQIMWENDCGCVPVVNEKGEAIGMITDRDVCMAGYTQGGRPLCELQVSSAMSNKVYGCAPGDSLEVAEQIMQEHQIRRLPVLGFEGQLVGILSLNDLARAATQKKFSRGSGTKAAAIEATLAAVCQPRTNHVTAAANAG